MSTEIPARTKTRQVMVGNVAVGGDAPVSVQSMCTTHTADVAETLSQIERLAELDCEIIRVTLPKQADVEAFREICARSPLPVVADIHFDYRLAIAAASAGAAALRINPGNIGSFDKVDAILEAASEVHIPIRIGVNAGSLAKEFDEIPDMDLSEKLVSSAESFVQHFEAQGFYDIVLSAKAHDVPTTIKTYRALSKRLPEIPLHIGVTEAGTLRQGTVKNVSATSILLAEGIGSTMRLSLTADPAEEVLVAWDLLSALNMRRNKPELVSCPTCGRTEVDLVSIAREVEERLQGIKLPLSVAVMGCVVNGPGEAKDADIGVACGRGQGAIFVGTEIVAKVSENKIVDTLMDEIAARWGECAT